MQCPACKAEELVAIERAPSVSAAGILGVLIALFGLFVMLFHIVGGLLIIIVAVLISMAGRRKIAEMVCPACKYREKL